MISNKSPVLRAPNGPAKSGLYHNLDVGTVGVSSWVGQHMARVIRTSGHLQAGTCEPSVQLSCFAPSIE